MTTIESMFKQKSKKYIEEEKRKENFLEMIETIKKSLSSSSFLNFEKDDLVKLFSLIPIKFVKTSVKGKNYNLAMASAIKKCKNLNKAKFIILYLTLDETSTLHDFTDVTNIIISACSKDTKVLVGGNLDKKDECEISIIYY